MSGKKTKKKTARKKKNSAINTRKKKVTLAVIVALAVCAAALVILYATGVIRFEKVETVISNRTGVAYVNYADENMIINSDGRVLESSDVQPEDIPLLTGIEFTKIVSGEHLEYEVPEAFEYAIKLIMALRTNEIAVREINISADLEASAYVNRITILFGKDDKTEIKAADLADFFDQVKDLKGTLHMEVVNEKLGYTFKQESENTAIIQEPATGAKREDNGEEEDTQDGEEVNNEEFVEEEYYEEPVGEEGVYEEEVYEEPVYEEEVYEEPVYEEPVYEEEVYEEPVYEEPVYEEPVYEEGGQEW